MDEEINDLELNRENLAFLIQEAIENRLSQYRLAEWAYNYCYLYWSDLGKPEEKAYVNDKGLEVAMDIDAQWDLYLTTYTPSELKTMDLNQIKMPEQWLRNWINQLRKQAPLE